MNNLLPLILALGYGLGGFTLGGPIGATIGAGAGLLGSSFINNKRQDIQQLASYFPNPALRPEYIQEQQKKIDTITTMALLLAGLGGGLFLGNNTDILKGIK
jgi:hypothetical protein